MLAGRSVPPPMYRDEIQALRDEAVALKAELEAARLKNATLAAEKVATERRARAQTHVIRRTKAHTSWFFALIGLPLIFATGAGAFLLASHLASQSAELAQLQRDLDAKDVALTALQKEAEGLRKDVTNLEKWRRYSDSGHRSVDGGRRQEQIRKRLEQWRAERHRRLEPASINKLF